MAAAAAAAPPTTTTTKVSSDGAGCAVEVISIDPERGLVVDEDALRAILLDPAVQDLPVAVICVAGGSIHSYISQPFFPCTLFLLSLAPFLSSFPTFSFYLFFSLSLV